jgi:type VI secretion system protein ImpH
MAGENRPAADHLTWLRAIAGKARHYGFFPVIRGAEARAGGLPRVGQSRMPSQNVVDIAHAPHLAFAGATLDGIEFGARTGRATVRGQFVGLTGPMGALPIHMTEFALLERRNSRTQPFGRFLDLISDRMLQFFYRAWADSQPVCHADRPDRDRFAGYLGEVTGAREGADPLGAFPFEARLHYVGLFASRRSAAIIQDGLTHLLRTPVQVQEFVGRWREIEPEDRTRLGGSGDAAMLGGGAVLGARVRLVEDTFGLIAKVEDERALERFMPGGDNHRLARAAVEALKPSHLDWELTVQIDERKAPAARLDGGTRLGWTSWLAPAGRAVLRSDAKLRSGAGTDALESHRGAT